MDEILSADILFSRYYYYCGLQKALTMYFFTFTICGV